MIQQVLEVNCSGGICRIVLNRPDKRNALSRELIQNLHAQIQTAAQEDSTRLVVISANGPVFCAGMDLAEMQDRASKPDAQELWEADTQVYHDLLVDLLTIPKPTLAIVQGPALAGGVGLVAACDLVLAAESASFSLPEPKRGITAAVVAPLVCYRAGIQKTSFLLFSGQSLTAKESGLCHQIVSSIDLQNAEHDLCQSILTGAPAALAATKNHFLQTAGVELLNQLEAGMKVSAQARETQDAREGLAAFLEKRAPSWNPN